MRCLGVFAAVLWVLGNGVAVDGMVIDFDDAGVTGVAPGDLYADRGVVFTTGAIPNEVSVGGTVLFSDRDDHFQIFNDYFSISHPNCAGTTGAWSHDLLMSFSTPVTSVELTTDDAYPEPAADLVRLLALAPTATPHEYVVLAYDEGLDDVVESPENLLSVTASSPFSFALFQITSGGSDREGLDNLTFTPVPEPTVFSLLAMGAIGLLGYAWRRRKS